LHLRIWKPVLQGVGFGEVNLDGLRPFDQRELLEFAMVTGLQSCAQSGPERVSCLLACVVHSRALTIFEVSPFHRSTSLLFVIVASLHLLRLSSLWRRCRLDLRLEADCFCFSLLLRHSRSVQDQGCRFTPMCCVVLCCGVVQAAMVVVIRNFRASANQGSL
jgi:hypothetical protein